MTPIAPIRINLHAFGPATVRRYYTHREDSTALVADVVADSGEILHLSPAYIARLTSEARA